MNQLHMTQMMRQAQKLRAAGQQFTLLGVGPMSRTCIEAALTIAQERDFPMMFIASRNQVDSDEFGHGYVCGFDQFRFAEAVTQAEDAIGFHGLCYLCRDHGGPWQRDEERSAALPENEAMERARRSYLADLKAGFDLLHIDPTKDPHIEGTIPLSLVLKRTIELIEALELQRRALGLPEPAYEVGTEETNGGLTSERAFAEFIESLLKELSARGLPAPAFIVGQTGTLTRLTENVGHFNPLAAKSLSETAMRFGVGIKEHNGDYLADALLLGHPHWGVTAMNVAPEFGYVETCAYLEMAALEQREFGDAACSHLDRAIAEEAVRSERWRKWMLGDDRMLSVQDALGRPETLRVITNICGHYTFETAAFQEAFAVMCRNLSSIGINAGQYAKKKIMDSIDRYACCFGLYGLTGKLLSV